MPATFTAPKICAYFRSTILAKLQFERDNTCGLPVTEHQFMQIWLRSLDKGTGFVAELRAHIQAQMSLQVTVVGRVEVLAHRFQITDDPNALNTAFTQNVQTYSEQLQDYLLRKQKEANMVLLDEEMSERHIIEQIIRGIKETDPVKHKLLTKFDKGKIRL